MFRFAILRRMAEKPPPRELGKVLVTVRDSPRFPADLWQRFRETARERNESWIDALRRIVEQYVRQEPKP
jgi:hypothetical protein